MAAAKIPEYASLQRHLAVLPSPKKPPSSTTHQAIDFGWRLHGKSIRVLPDSSLRLLPTGQRATAALLTEYCADGNSLLSCLQCGACTVSCQLAETDGALFPRRQMTLLQLGEVDKLLTDPTAWLCFNCADCTSRCPAQAGPGRIMAAVRRLAVEHYSVSPWLSRLSNQRRGFLCMLLAGIALLLTAIGVGGSFSPQPDPVRYASMLPHFTVNVFFSAIVGLVIIIALIGAARAWKAFTGVTLRRADPVLLVHSLLSVARKIAAHSQFSKCQQFSLSRWAHIAISYGFLTLLLLAGVAATLIRMGAPYPLPLLHPFKTVGNLAAMLLVSGSLYFWVQRQRASSDKDPSSWFDWVLLLELLLVSVTGVLAEVFRYASVAVLAYPTYFLHLVFVFVLLAGSASSKLAHVFYRTVALTAEEYKAISAVPLQDLAPRREAA